MNTHAARRVAAVAGAFILAGALAVTGPNSPATAATPPAPGTGTAVDGIGLLSSPQCSAATAVNSWVLGGGSEITATCSGGTSSWSYVVHAGCLGSGTALTLGPALTTQNLHDDSCDNSPVIVQIAVYTSGTTPPAHPDPNLSSVSFPDCSVTTSGGYPNLGSFHGSCDDGSSAWRYAAHGACTGPGGGTAVTIGAPLTTGSLSDQCPWGSGTPWVLQVVTYTDGGSRPSHPDPSLNSLCPSGTCPH